MVSTLAWVGINVNEVLTVKPFCPIINIGQNLIRNYITEIFDIKHITTLRILEAVIVPQLPNPN